MLGVTGDEELDVADFPILKCNCQNVAYVSLISNVIVSLTIEWLRERLNGTSDTGAGRASWFCCGMALP